MPKTKAKSKPKSNSKAVKPTSEKASIEKKDHSHVTLLRSPIKTLTTLITLIFIYLKTAIIFMIRHVLLILALAGIIGAFLYAPGPHEIVIKFLDNPLIVPSDCHRIPRVCSMVDWPWSVKFHWIRNWSPYICLIPGSSHCKSNYGR